MGISIENERKELKKSNESIREQLNASEELCNHLSSQVQDLKDQNDSLIDTKDEHEVEMNNMKAELESLREDSIAMKQELEEEEEKAKESAEALMQDYELLKAENEKLTGDKQDLDVKLKEIVSELSVAKDDLVNAANDNLMLTEKVKNLGYLENELGNLVSSNN